MKPILLGTICALLASAGTLASAAPSANVANAPAQHLTDTTSAAAQQPVPPPRSNPKLERIIQTMGEVSTEGHPDLFGQFSGIQRLFKGDYKGALKYFKLGARYADKLSQLSIGMMYLHGRGVSKDPATACAWITLAAERGFPSYVNARDHICGALSPAQHDQATATLDKLRPEYGDKVAKQRMKLALTMAKNSVTGSLLGADANVRTMSLNNDEGPANCGGYTLFLGGVEVPRRGCGRYDPKLLNPKKYFAARDAQWFGTVTVGELRKVDPPASTAPAKTSEDGH